MPASMKCKKLESIRILLALTLMMSLLIAFFSNYGVRKSSDDIGLYMSALQVEEPDKYQEQRPHILAALEHRDDYMGPILKFTQSFREKFKGNYSAIVEGLAFYRHIVFSSDKIKNLADYTDYTHNAHMSVHYIFFGLCFCVFCLTVLRSKDIKILIPAIFLFVCLLVFTLKPTYFWYISQVSDFYSLNLRGVIFFTFTQRNFDIFAASPRSIATFLALIAFLLRFDNRHNLAYWVISAAVFFHALYALFCVLMFLMLDSAFRPKFIQKNKTVLFVTIFASICVLLTSNTWSSFGSSSSFLPYIVLLVLGLSQIKVFVEFFRKIFRVEKWFLGNTLHAEFLCIWAMVYVSWLISYVAYLLYNDDIAHLFTTAEIAPRITGLLRPVVLYSFIYLFYEKYCNVTVSQDMRNALVSISILGLISVFYINGSIAYYKSLNANYLGPKTYEKIYLKCHSRGSTLMNADRYAACKIDGVCDKAWDEVCPFKAFDHEKA